MTIVVDKATVATLIAERAVLFEHQFHVQGITVFCLLVACLALFVWGYLDRSQRDHGDSTSPLAPALLNVGIALRGNGGTRMLFAVVGALLVVGIALGVWTDTYFEQKQFERAPETYVIKHLR
jgi:nitric oxide reductase large subunit